jgi:uncharacterized protein
MVRDLPGLFVRMLLPVAAVLLLDGVPWLLVVLAPHWPAGVTIPATAFLAAMVLVFPLLMLVGHGPMRHDRTAIAGDVWLGSIFQLFTWSLFGLLAWGVALLAGAPATPAAKVVALVVLAWWLVTIVWSNREAMRLPRVRHRRIVLDRLGPGLAGLRIVLVADTHYGPIDRARWSQRLRDLVNTLDADILAHAGDIADGTPEQRSSQASPLAGMTARLARVVITGNHEYFSSGAAWVRYMEELGWTALHNKHLVVERGGDRLVLAGVDDRTAARSREPGHGADLPKALAGAEAGLPIVLLAHQPRQVGESIRHDVDLQLSGHSHGGQIWPFHFLVRLEQKALHGLSRPGGRTQLYISRGSGFWGPPFRLFAPSEVTVLELVPA